MQKKRLLRCFPGDFAIKRKPNWESFSDLLDFAETVRRDARDLRPRDMTFRGSSESKVPANTLRGTTRAAVRGAECADFA